MCYSSSHGMHPLSEQSNDLIHASRVAALDLLDELAILVQQGSGDLRDLEILHRLRFLFCINAVCIHGGRVLDGEPADRMAGQLDDTERRWCGPYSSALSRMVPS